MTKATVDRYVRAGEVARIAMGKTKSRGEKPRDNAADDPLAWWCLTELIANGIPRVNDRENFRQFRRDEQRKKYALCKWP